MAKFKIINPDGTTKSITPPKPEPPKVEEPVAPPKKKAVMKVPVSKVKQAQQKPPVVQEEAKPVIGKALEPVVESIPEVKEEAHVTINKEDVPREPSEDIVETKVPEVKIPEPKVEEPKVEEHHKKIELNDSLSILKPISRKSHKYDMEETNKKEDINIPNGAYILTKDDLNNLVDTIVTTLSDTFVSKEHLSHEVERAIQNMVINNDTK